MQEMLSLAETERIVSKAWDSALRRKSVDRDADFRNVGMNHNRAMQIVRDIWWATKIELPVNVFYTAPTIRRMAAAIRDGSAFVTPDLIRLRDGDDAAPLFLFPGGGGVLFELESLVTAFDWPGVIYGIPFPGLDAIGPSPYHFEQEAARSLTIIRRVQKTGPYRLAGYSIGGITALETARLIRQEGEERIFLGLIDTPQNDHSWPWDVWLRFIIGKLASRLRKSRGSRSARSARSATFAPQKRNIHPPRRGSQISFRFRNPNHPNYPYFAPYWVPYHTPNYSRVGAIALRMKGFYTLASGEDRGGIARRM